MVFSRLIKNLTNSQREKVKNRLAFIYAAVTWNAFIIAIIYTFNKQRDVAGLPKGFSKVLTEKTESAQIIRFNGLKVAENTFYNKKELDDIRKEMLNPFDTMDSEGDDDFD